MTWNIEAHFTVNLGYNITNTVIIIYSTDSYLSQEILRKYEREGAVRGLYQPVEFEADTITLDIPMEGITIKDWKITPLIRPVVSSCGHHNSMHWY